MKSNKLKCLDRTDSDYLNSIVKDIQNVEIRLLVIKVSDDSSKYSKNTLRKIYKAYKHIKSVSLLVDELLE